ncbi:hypothetical protein [Streptomyces bullii]|uniref:Uncharacterized protein n=1 Tax=Streptomyces bullii TaxID=349910 RepID=A0ABW0V2Z4_9ACTN
MSGAYEARSALLEAFAEASIAARYISPEATGPDEESKGWVRAEFHEGQESPSSEFQQDCLSRATKLGEQFGYVIRSYGIVMASAAQLRHVINKRTGKLVTKGFNLSERDLGWPERQFGVPAEFLELQEPPGVWDVPEA